MAETTTGQAIALGTLSRPDTSKPFTQAVLRGQELNLRKKQQEQQERKRMQDLENTVAQMLDVGKGGFIPIYQEQARDLIAKSQAEILNRQQQGDIIGANAIRMQAKMQIDDLLAENKQFSDWQSTARQGGLIPQEVVKITNMPFSQAKQEYAKLIQQKPEYKEILELDERNNRFVPRPVKEVNYNNYLNTTVSNLLANSSSVETDKKGNFIRYKYNVTPESIDIRANELSADDDLRVNVVVRRPSEVKKYFDAIVAANKLDINDPQQREAAKKEAVKQVIKGDILASVEKVRQSPAAQGGGGNNIIKTPQQGTAKTIKVLHPTEVKRNGKVVEIREDEYETTSAYSAQVEITNGAVNTSMVRDAKTGKPTTNTDPITILKSALVQVYPVYNNKARGSLRGRIVGNDNIKDANSEMYDWKPVVIGVTDDNEQVLVEFDANNEVMNMLKKGGKSREAQTQYDVDQAKAIADKKNREKANKKPSVQAKPSAQKKTMSKTDWAKLPLAKRKELLKQGVKPQ